MGDKTGIQWTDSTWNPVSGCSKVSQGCKNCYAETVFPRPYPGRDFTDVRSHPERLDQPLRWARPRRIFVNSMSDLFHEKVPFAFIDRIFAVMAATPRHTYQILTKRHERMAEYFAGLKRGEIVWAARREYSEGGMHHEWPLPNVWLGVSVEDQENAEKRIPVLLATPAAVRFLSCEPLLGPLDFGVPSLGLHPLLQFNCPRCDCAVRDRCCPVCGTESHQRDAIDWVIVGGESGRKARPFNIEWASSIVQQCSSAGVPCFVKQLGAKPFLKRTSSSTSAGPGFRLSVTEATVETDLAFVDRKGGDWNEWPADLRVREFPNG